MRCVVLCGAGRAFAAGADVAGLRELSAAEVLAGERGRAGSGCARSRLPVVAAVHGWCLGGGCELALTCDIVLAAEDARFGLPETGLGLIPGAGGTQRLPRIAGRSLALEVILGGRTLIGARGAAARHLLARRGARGARARGARAGRAHRRRPALAVRLAREAVRAGLRVAARGRAGRGAPALRAGLRERRRPRGNGRVRRAARAELERRCMTEEPTHRVERDGAVATVTLDRPDALNAQTRASRRALVRDLRALSADDGRALRRADGRRPRVLRGPGSARAGRAGERRRHDPRDLHPDRGGARRACPSRSIAAINGAAAGAGLSIALACDLRYMAEDAVLMMAFSNIGARARLRRHLAPAAHRRLRAGLRARGHGPPRRRRRGARARARAARAAARRGAAGGAQTAAPSSRRGRRWRWAGRSA